MTSEVQPYVHEGVVVDGPDYHRWARAMVECTSEYDYAELTDGERARFTELLADIKRRLG